MPIITENEYTFTSANGSTPIHVREWVPDCDINAVVQISHGICEYAGRYAPFARYLASKGFVVVANDHLGHGQSVLSEEDLGYFGPLGSWETVVADIEQLRRLTAEKWPESPYFLLGHSMGSFLARTWLIRHPEVELAGVILSGTGQPAAPVLAAGRMLCDADVLKNGPRHRSLDIYGMAFGSYNKKIEPRRSPYDWLTRDEAVVDAYAADPLCTFTPHQQPLPGDALRPGHRGQRAGDKPDVKGHPHHPHEWGRRPRGRLGRAGGKGLQPARARRLQGRGLQVLPRRAA